MYLLEWSRFHSFVLTLSRNFKPKFGTGGGEWRPSILHPIAQPLLRKTTLLSRTHAVPWGTTGTFEHVYSLRALPGSQQLQIEAAKCIQLRHAQWAGNEGSQNLNQERVIPSFSEKEMTPWCLLRWWLPLRKLKGVIGISRYCVYFCPALTQIDQLLNHCGGTPRFKSYFLLYILCRRQCIHQCVAPARSIIRTTVWLQLCVYMSVYVSAEEFNWGSTEALNAAERGLVLLVKSLHVLRVALRQRIMRNLQHPHVICMLQCHHRYSNTPNIIHPKSFQPRNANSSHN